MIDTNSEEDEASIREACFWVVGIADNGDYLVVDFSSESGGAVGFLSVDVYWGCDAEHIRKHFIPIAKTVGQYFYDTERGVELPADYEEALKTINSQP